jgi:hypothetical protein
MPKRKPRSVPLDHQITADAHNGNAVTRDDIACKAYELWIERGGDAKANWLDAEAMLRQEAQAGARR